ncbi:uncharacterized protein LOC132902179 [Amyelois transitella]|uniref:uncharacterized protein LOC132902179 n=1 Tax=Amyelois transitella TaxID=680683 RepID=UPI0029904108|nr:uncharacterized protein LOC132902179 [Amyelois transitella]
MQSKTTVKRCIRDSSPEKRGSEEISADYYYGFGVLRSGDKTNLCQNKDYQLLCHVNCGGDHVCLNGKCYCFTAFTNTVGKLYPALLTPHKGQDSGETADYEGDDEFDSDPTKKRNSLRHQIAHFCPNLDIAKKCIMKCMDEGKPAFCGKDHVCYCGHRDSHTKGGPKVDAYKEFKGLYDKYLMGLGAKTTSTA